MIIAIIKVLENEHVDESESSQSFCRSLIRNLLWFNQGDRIWREESDIWIWKPTPSWEFFSKSFCKALEVPSDSHSCCSCAWQGLVPPRVATLCWLAIASKVSAMDNLGRIWCQRMSNVCSLCGKERETINHLFLHCDTFSFLWSHFFSKCGLAWCLSKSLSGFNWSLEIGVFSWFSLLLWLMIPYSILWSIWKVRKDFFFYFFKGCLVICRFPTVCLGS